MNRGCPEWPFYGQHGALVARVAAIHRLQGRGCSQRERKEHPEERSRARFHRSEGVSRLPAANP